MGCFTFTLANKPLKYSDNAFFKDFSASCKARYDAPAYVQCPDGSVIAEPSYEGYGIFGGKDIYDLVVDWNKAHLLDIMEKIPYRPKDIYWELAKAVQEGRENACLAIVQKAISNGTAAPLMLTDWKRSLGIEISCGENNAALPYPIKITSTAHPRKSYADLPASRTCQ